MKHISPDQLSFSLQRLAKFRTEVNKQGLQHILPFLAIKRKGVNYKEFTPYSEKDDYEFFSTYLEVRPGKNPYFDPFASLFRISTHPHSNVATARKGTFFRAWEAAESKLQEEVGIEVWRLNPECLEIIKQKALKKGGRVTQVPGLALAAFLFRRDDFPDNFTQDDLADKFAKEFNLDNRELDELFSMEETLPNFSTTPLSLDKVLEVIAASGVVAEVRETRTDFQERSINDDDEILSQVRSLLFEDGYAGVTFVGPPGTSKSWYAAQVALALTDGDITLISKIQFHKSYQYENFVEGFVPTSDGKGFQLREQVMLKVISQAEIHQDETYVVLIDELSRSDPGRVFGELLTYMEPSRRDESFMLASGREISIPSNIVFIATMNSRDKSISEIDDAFERRMAKIEFLPNNKLLEEILKENGIDEGFVRRIVAYFDWVNSKYPLGHTFFLKVKDHESLKRLWDTQLKFIFEKQYKYEDDLLLELRSKFMNITGLDNIK